jgi:two-component system, NtrC family, sensor kinase
VISSSLDGIIAISKVGMISLWNAAAAQIFGVPAVDVVGKALRETSAASKNPMILGMFRRVLTGERVVIHDLEFERVDGRRIWLGGHGAPIYDASGAIAGALVVVSDVTQERAAKRQMQQTEKLSALGQLAAGVAHELNNPLTSVIGYAQLLRNASAEEQVQRDLDRVIKQAKRAARIVQNLLTFVGDHEPRRIPTDINDVLRTALEMRAYELRAANIAVESDLAPDLPITLADYHQLQQVFFNLILNAEQAMLESHNGGRLALRTRLIDDAVLRVEIQDDGPGIAAENLSRIFDPFFTTKVVGKGTGLGLSICYGIIEEHGGRIWAESDADAGATFTIDLPLIEVKRRVSDSVKTDAKA